MEFISIRKGRRLLAYYLFLLVALFVLTRPGYLPPTIIRYALFFSIFLPTFFYPRILPAVSLLFCGVTMHSFVHVIYMDEKILLAVVLICYLLYNKKSAFLLNVMAFISYFFICALVSLDVRTVFVWLVIVALLSDMIKDGEDLMLLFYAFIFFSLYIGLLFLLHQGEFMMQYGRAEDDLERSGWINNNMFGGAIASGGILAMAYLTEIIKLNRNRITIILCVVTGIVVFAVLALNASRGAFIAFVLSSAMMVMLTKVKTLYKVLILIASVTVIFFLYNNNYFDLLQARFGDDTAGSMGGRSSLWSGKLQAFFNSSNVFQLLFGVGQTKCVSLANSMSTHNDLVTALIAYGFVGFAVFLYFLFYPIKKANKEQRLNVSALLLYLVIECVVLEPFFRGYIIEIMFYFFILKFVLIKNLNSY